MMKKNLSLIILLSFIILSLTGCYMKEAILLRKGTPLQPINFAAGSRILISETTPGFVTYEIKKFRREIKPSNFVIIEPPAGKYSGTVLPTIVKRMASEMDVDMIFVAVVLGKSARYTEKGKLTKNNSSSKIIIKKFSCDVYQYNRNGELIGHKMWSAGNFPIEIKYSGSNVYYDATVDFQNWLNNNLSSV